MQQITVERLHSAPIHQTRLIDKDGILKSTEGGTRIHPDVAFSEEDASSALLLLTKLELDMLIFGWEEDRDG